MSGELQGNSVRQDEEIFVNVSIYDLYFKLYNFAGLCNNVWIAPYLFCRTGVPGENYREGREEGTVLCFRSFLTSVIHVFKPRTA